MLQHDPRMEERPGRVSAPTVAYFLEHYSKVEWDADPYLADDQFNRSRRDKSWKEIPPKVKLLLAE